MSESGVTVSSRVLGPIDHESDVTIAGFILQHHLHTILKYLSSPEPILRSSALGLLDTLLNQGMLCPLDVLSHLVSLQGDIVPEIRFESLKTLQTLDEKYPNFLESRFIDGVELSYQNQIILYQTTAATENSLFAITRKISTNEEDDDDDELHNINNWSPSIFKSLYVTCFQNSKKKRYEIICSLLRRSLSFLECLEQQGSINSPSNSNTGSRNVSPRSNSGQISPRSQLSTGNLLQSQIVISKGDIDYLKLCEKIAYIFSTISSLPYENSDESLTVVYWLNRNVPVKCTHILTEVRKYLMEVHAIEPTIMSSDNATMSLCGSPMPKLSLQSSTTGCSNEKLEFHSGSFKQYFNESANQSKLSKGASLQVIELIKDLMRLTIVSKSYEYFLKLKYFIKSAYGLTDERCFNFSPEAKSLGFDRSKIVENCPVYDISAYLDICEDISQLHDTISSGNKILDEDVDIISGYIEKLICYYNDLTDIIESDGSDFTLAIKKKRISTKPPKTPSANSGHGDSIDDGTEQVSLVKPIKVNKKVKMVKKVVKKKKRRFNDLEPIDENDCDSDEDY